MKFSIRELGILTAYTALLFSNDPNLQALVSIIVVAVAVFVLLAFAIAKRTGSTTRRKTLGFLVILISVYAMLTFDFGPLAGKALGGMVVGMFSASIPIFLLLGARQPELTQDAIKIGRTSPFVAAIAGCAAILVGAYLANIAVWPIFNDPFQAIHFKTSAIAGEIGAAMTIWMMDPKTKSTTSS